MDMWQRGVLYPFKTINTSVYFTDPYSSSTISIHSTYLHLNL